MPACVCSDGISEMLTNRFPLCPSISGTVRFTFTLYNSHRFAALALSFVVDKKRRLCHMCVWAASYTCLTACNAFHFIATIYIYVQCHHLMVIAHPMQFIVLQSYFTFRATKTRKHIYFRCSRSIDK